MNDETKEVKSQVAGTISTLMTVAFGLIAALAWIMRYRQLYWQYCLKEMA